MSRRSWPELKKKYPDEKFDSNGTLYVGEKGIFYTASTAATCTSCPRKMKEIPEPPKSLPRPKLSSPILCSPPRRPDDTAATFDYSAQLTEFAILGNLAQHAGKGNKVEWDGAEMKFVNLPDLNRFVTRDYRAGWQFQS